MPLNLLTVCFNVQCSCLLRLVFLRSGPQPYVKKNLVVVAVDEAHCVEEWLGITFCFFESLSLLFSQKGWTSFRKIGGLRALCDAPFMALTATASPVTQRSIADSEISALFLHLFLCSRKEWDTCKYMFCWH